MLSRVEFLFCFFAWFSSPVVTSGSKKKPEEAKPKKPVVVLSLDTSKAKPREEKVNERLQKMFRPLTDNRNGCLLRLNDGRRNRRKDGLTD